MALDDHVGREVRQSMLDGRTLISRLTFGDFLRAESAQGKNLLGELGGDELPSLNDLAQIVYSAMERTGQFVGTYDDWVRAIDGFPDIDTDDEPEGEGGPVVAPFPQATPQESL